MHPTATDLRFTCSERISRSDINQFVPKSVFQIENFWSVHPDHPLVCVDQGSIVDSLIEFFYNFIDPGSCAYVVVTFNLLTGHMEVTACGYVGDLPDAAHVETVYEGKYCK